MINAWLLFVAGLGLGALLIWLLIRNRAVEAEATAAGLRQQQEKLQTELDGVRARLETELTSRAAAQASLEAEQKNLEEQKGLLEDARQKLSDTFKSLSSEVLRAQSESFLKLADQSFSKLRAEAAGDMGKRQEAIGGLVQPLKEALERYESELKNIESSRMEAYGSLRQHLTQLGETQNQLQRETANLVTALRKPQVRGRWGEITLRRVAEPLRDGAPLRFL